MEMPPGAKSTRKRVSRMSISARAELTMLWKNEGAAPYAAERPVRRC
jgi:hypothetical protein